MYQKCLLVLTVVVASSSYVQAQATAYKDRQDLSYYLDANGRRHAIRSPKSWLIRRKHVLAGMQLVMGKLPTAKRSPLAVRVLERVELGRVVRIKLTYQSDATDRVTAFLMRPTVIRANAPVAAMLCLHQTARKSGKKEPAGLAGKSTMHYGLELAQRGYVVLMPDYPNMGEHKYDFARHPEYKSGTMKAIWDNLRAIDYLLTLPYVDSNRIGVLGHSLGGHNAMFTAAFDRRIAAIVSSCGFTRFHKDDPPSWTAPTYMPRIASVYGNDANRIPFDFPEVIASFAPRPFLAVAAERDHDFAVSGVRDSVKSARYIYQLYNKSANLAAFYPETRHDFVAAARYRAYAFLDQHLRTYQPPHPQAIPNSHVLGEVDKPQLVPFVVRNPRNLRGIVVDETEARLVGSWQYSTHTPPYVGVGYLHDRKRGKGKSSVTYTPKIPQTGVYEVRLSHCYNIRRSTNTPVTIHHADGQTTLRINQQQVPSYNRLFRSLGKFRFKAGKQGWVRISNGGTEGKYVIADAVQFLPVKSR